MGHAIDADADRHREGRIAFAFDENAGELGASQQQVVRPFHLEQRSELRRAGRHRVMQRERGNERQLRRVLGRRRFAQ